MSSPVQRRPELTGWQVHLSKVPVAVSAADPAWPAGDRGVLNNLAGALAYGFDAVRDVWEQAHRAAGVTGYRIRIGAGPAARRWLCRMRQSGTAWSWPPCRSTR